MKKCNKIAQKEDYFSPDKYQESRNDNSNFKSRNFSEIDRLKFLLN